MSIVNNGSGTIAYVGIGANLGDARAQVLKAVQSIAALNGVKLIKRSSLFRSAPVDAPTGIENPDFVNAVVCIETTLTAQALLDALRGVEARAGRVRHESVARNSPRTLDLDVLLYGDERIDTATLQVPHPRMWQRAFVLLPLVEIAPDLVIPGVGRASGYVIRVMDQEVQRLVEEPVA